MWVLIVIIMIMWGFGGMYCCGKWFDIRKVVGINKGKNVCMKFNIVICFVW